ncbi:MAG: SPOR domain-containing protein [Nitrospinaceae bacterium]|nr:SPOR domain-containing protein [Nitrospinaceae bacterium]
MQRMISGIFLFFSVAAAQNIDLYLSLINEGRVLEVRDALPELKSRVPNNDGVASLDALTTTNGDSSIRKFQFILRQFPRSRFADEATLKIGEYMFARGLYSQASAQLKKALFYYKDGENHQRTLDLLVNSFEATGERDSARIYLRWAMRHYPGLSYAQYGYKNLKPAGSDLKLVKLDAGQTTSAKKDKKRIKPKPWIVQVGAFRKYDNARKLKEQIVSGGFPVQIDEVASHGMRLHAVRVVRFERKEDAEQIGKRIQKEFGVSYRVLNRPK